MLTEMAKMSLADGLVMQIHPGSVRDHNPRSSSLRPGQGRRHSLAHRLCLRAETAARPVRQRARFDDHPVHARRDGLFARTRAARRPLPRVKLGPAWWFYDSPEGIRRYRENVTETAGFYNTVGFNDDTRAFLSIPARHDVSRRVDCAFLARLVAEHRLEMDEAFEVAHDLAYGLAKSAYKL